LRKRMPKKVSRKLVFGGVAADVTKIAFPHNGLTFGVVADHSKDVIQKKLKEVCRTAENYDLFKGGSGPIVYWFQIHIAALVLLPQTLTSRFSSNHIYRTPRNRRELSAVNDFWEIFSRVSVDDSRSISPKPVKPRKSITLPKGTKFSINENLMKELLSGNEISERDDNFTVGGMEVQGIEIEFSIREVKEALESFEEDERAEMAKNFASPQSQAMLLAVMWARQHPFEIVDDEE